MDESGLWYLIFLSKWGVGSAILGSSRLHNWGKMTSGVTTKVRLVQCPKCRQVLPELADFPLYKCGGCGTILQGNNL